MDGEEVIFICRDRIVAPQKFILYSESLKLCSSNDVLLIVDCTDGTDVSVVGKVCEVEVSGLFGDGDGEGGASADRRSCTVLKKPSNFNCLPP